MEAIEMSAYREIVVETFENRGEPARERIRARPMAGQGLSTSLRVECSAKMRGNHPIGTKLKILAKVTKKEGGTPFLYCHFSWPYEVLSDIEAAAFISTNNPNAR